MTQLKTLQGKKFPRDFWNYNVNPITGFSESRNEDTVELTKRYYKQESSVSSFKND